MFMKTTKTVAPIGYTKVKKFKTLRKLGIE